MHVSRIGPILPAKSAPVSGSRRRFLARTSLLGLAAAAGVERPLHAAPIVNPPALLENTAGGYRVLPAGTVYCGGAVPLQGFEIVHAILQPWIPLDAAWAFVESHLKGLGRPVQALCGMELRIPQQLTIDGFRAFNAPYVEQLRRRELMLGNYSAVCRTNVAPAVEPPKQPSVHAFSYTVPSDYKGTTFCISGTADIDARGKIIAEGDVSEKGMRAKLQHCIEAVGERLAQLELDWSSVTHTDLCVARSIDDLMAQVVSPVLAGAATHGVRVHVARPPIVGTEVELECRGVRREVVVSA
jgi:hypothetical protein